MRLNLFLFFVIITMGKSTVNVSDDLTWSWRGSHASLLGELMLTGLTRDFTLLLGLNKEKVSQFIIV